MPGMISLTELKTAFDVSANTIRNWSSEYAPYLSAAANPPTGERRRFTADDAAALALVATMRADDKPLEIIRAHLDAGERGTWPPDAPAAAQNGPESASSRALVQSGFEHDLMRFAGQIQVLESQLDYYRQRSEEMHARAIAAETKLMLLGGGESDETHETAVSSPTKSAGDDTAVSWLSRLRRAWRGE
jgi:DNA-binding transcriptional MerR regulator